jgi:membrane-associated phospholipid phosphatase
MRGYKVAPYIWGIGLPLAATTAYLRIAADKHYTTDVIAGSLIGATAGLLIPRLTLTKKLPFEVSPTGSGLSISGVW